MSFGSKGSLLFAALNVLQLVGWTAIMIYDGALAANGILKTGAWVWAVVIGVLNHCMDSDWTDQSWQGQYGSDACTFCTDAGAF